MKAHVDRPENLRKFAIKISNIILAGIFCYCIYGATSKFLGSKIGVVITQRQLITVKYPSIKVCKNVPLGVDEKKDTPLIGSAEQSVQINNATTTVELTNGTEVKKLGIGHFWKHFSIYDVPPSKDYKELCSVMYSEGNVGIGGRLKLKLNTEDYKYDSTFYVALMDPWVDVNVNVAVFGQEKIVLQGPNESEHPNMTYYINYNMEIVEKTFINHGKRPCIEENEGTSGMDFQKCVFKTLGKRHGCPTLTSRKDMFTKCSKTSLRSLLKYLSDTNLLLSGEEKIIQEIGCYPPCKLRYFKLSSPLVVQFIDDQDTRHKLIFKIKIVKPTVEEQEEIYLYDSNNLMADVGGFLGMLLGASCVSLFDELLGIIIKLYSQLSG